MEITYWSIFDIMIILNCTLSKMFFFRGLLIFFNRGVTAQALKESFLDALGEVAALAAAARAWTPVGRGGVVWGR